MVIHVGQILFMPQRNLIPKISMRMKKWLLQFHTWVILNELRFQNTKYRIEEE